jgi:hypothetical protein
MFLHNFQKIACYLTISQYLFVDCLTTDCYYSSAGSLSVFSFYYPHNLLGQREPMASADLRPRARPHKTGAVANPTCTREAGTVANPTCAHKTGSVANPTRVREAGAVAYGRTQFAHTMAMITSKVPIVATGY